MKFWKLSSTFERRTDKQLEAVLKKEQVFICEFTLPMMPAKELKEAVRWELPFHVPFADGSYYYQDGVFYTMDANGEYKVILPPAGALVETLPEDYDMVTLNGEEYYKVDETVYKVTINEGKPYFEVLGQLYS